ATAIARAIQVENSPRLPLLGTMGIVPGVVAPAPVGAGGVVTVAVLARRVLLRPTSIPKGIPKSATTAKAAIRIPVIYVAFRFRLSFRSSARMAAWVGSLTEPLGEDMMTVPSLAAPAARTNAS